MLESSPMSEGLGGYVNRYYHKFMTDSELKSNDLLNQNNESHRRTRGTGCYMRSGM